MSFIAWALGKVIENEAKKIVTKVINDRNEPQSLPLAVKTEEDPAERKLALDQYEASLRRANAVVMENLKAHSDNVITIIEEENVDGTRNYELAEVNLLLMNALEKIMKQHMDSLLSLPECDKEEVARRFTMISNKDVYGLIDEYLANEKRRISKEAA